MGQTRASGTRYRLGAAWGSWWLTCALSLAPSPAAAIVLYQQPFVAGATSGYLPASFGYDNLIANDHRARLYTAFDDFTPAFSGSVETVTWRGLYLDWFSPTAAAANTTSWLVGIYADDGLGKPELGNGVGGGAVAVSSLVVEQVTAAGFYVVNVPVYEFTATLLNPAIVQTGSRYWLQVTSVADQMNPQFQWAPGTGGNASSLLLDSGANGGAGSFSVYGGDPGYRLSGTILDVPEPGSAALVAVGLACLFAQRRRRPGR